MISSEVVPFAKTGGLGDVCGSLPIALEQLGHQCSVFLPCYRSAMHSGLSIESTPFAFTIPMGGRHVACRISKSRLPNSQVTIYFIDQPTYFDRDGLYGDKQGEYRDNCERFAFFCRATMEAIAQMSLDIDIVHSHDWQAGLMPAYVSTGFGGYPWAQRAKSVMTIHNLAYQGRFWHYDMVLTGLDWQYYNWQQMEFYGQLNLMKTGIAFADAVTTVSPTYAREITEPEHGCALDGTLRDRGQSLIGIVNGVDYSHWNPAVDPYIPQKFDVHSWKVGKAECKRVLQAANGLAEESSTPLIGIIGRLADQKGWDLIIPLLQRALAEMQVQWVILGTGEERYAQQLKQLASHAPGKIAVRLEFAEALAHQIEAASDMFLMPSRYEPCGLNQLYSLRYGAVPVVHSTGGLVDTVADTTPQSLADGTATGFRFEGYNLESLRSAVERAVHMFGNQPELWEQIVATGMQQDWSWRQSAGAYERVYQQIRSPILISN
jgi:starch synthase